MGTTEVPRNSILKWPVQRASLIGMCTTYLRVEMMWGSNHISDDVM